MEKKRVLMVCLGNICRSPIAEAVFEKEINKRDLKDQWEVDSCALMGYHVGKKPDSRTFNTLVEFGITDYSHIVRKITPTDFKKFDWIFGMDSDLVQSLNNLKKNSEQCKAQVELLGNYYPNGPIEIEDPYYDCDSKRFQIAYEQSLQSITGFLDKYSN